MKSALLVVSLAFAARAYAQPTDPVLGEQLFNEGRDLAKANNWVAACPKFEASLRADPALGTRLNLATCYEKTNRLASAWSLYRESADFATKEGDTKRRDYALAQAKALEPRLPRLSITAPANPPAGLAVTRDHVAVDPAAFGSSLYLDPGSHVITAAAPGFEPFSKIVDLAEGKTETLAIPPLVASKTAPAPAPTPTPPTPTPPTETVVAHTKPAAPSSRAYLALGVGAGGLALVATGLVFGSKASGKYSDAKSLCGADLRCDSDADFTRGQQLVTDARSAATLSTVLVGVGGAALAAGIILYVTAPSAARTETAHVVPVVTDRSAALVLGGQF